MGPSVRNKSPFFILGCVRSGTTLLRDVLRCHPNLASPEETQFYRWAEPFGVHNFRKILLNNPVLKKHREIDGIEEKGFRKILDNSVSRGDLYRRYMRNFIKRNKPEARRWFDKSPQNVYGAAMIAMEFPAAKFIHIVRNPFNVVSSLRVGKIIKVEEIVGACSYWNEAAEILQVIKRAYPKRVYEVKYEDFTSDPMAELEKVLNFLDEDFNSTHYRHVRTIPKQHDVRDLFSDEEILKIEKLCSRWGQHYGYLSTHSKEDPSFPSIAKLGV